MSTLKADALTTKSDNTDLTITGGGTGVPNLETGYKVNGTVEKLTGIAPGSSGNLLTSDGTDWTSAAAAGGFVKQVVSVKTSSVATSSATMPIDNTIPQITEGTEYMSLAITPQNASNRLVIDVVIILASSGGGGSGVGFGLFQDTTSNALAGASRHSAGANQIMVVSFRHVMVAGTTSSTTFRVRAGSSGGSTITFNGNAGNPGLGGSMASTIVITEIEP